MQDTIERLSVDPNELLVDVNIRHDSKADKDLIASVKEHGVIQPIIAVRTASGELRVRHGHRRTHAAVEAGVQVPVDVIGNEGDDDATAVERILTQYAENEHRQNLTTADKVAAVQQLAAFGVKASEITKKTRIPKAEVKQATDVAKSEVAKTVTAKYDLTLDQATAVAEFEDDKEAVKALVVTAEKEPEKFAHKLQELRDERTARLVAEPTTEELRDAGVTILDERPVYSESTKQLFYLPGFSYRDKEGNAKKHKSCPGHVAYVDAWTEEDYDDDGQPLPDPEWNVDVEYYCTQPDLHNGKKAAKTGAEAADAAATKEAEKAKAERKKKLDGNKKWRAAEAVRKEWLKTLLLGKKVPQGALQFIASNVVGRSGYFFEQGQPLAKDLLGIDDQGDNWTDAQATLAALGIVLCSHEVRFGGVQTWPSPSKDAAAYFSQLIEWGYGPSDIEQTVIDKGSKSKY